MDSEKVLVIGFEKSQLAQMNENINGIFSFVLATDVKQVLQMDYFAVIIDWQQLDAKVCDQIRRFFLEVDGGSSLKVIIGGDKLDWSKISDVLLFDDFEQMISRIEPYLKKAKIKGKNLENLANNVSYVFSILEMIQNSKGISTSQLAKEIGRSEQAVKRFLEILILTDKDIKYEYESGFWTMI